jgi:hypothetical protein
MVLACVIARAAAPGPMAPPAGVSAGE